MVEFARNAREIHRMQSVDNYLAVLEPKSHRCDSKAEQMYELSDWGSPVAPPEFIDREKLTTRLPHSLVRVLRSRARVQGVSLNVFIDQLLHQALALPDRHESDRATFGSAFD